MTHLIYCWSFHKAESALCRLCICLQQARLVAFAVLLINTSISIYELQRSSAGTVELICMVARMLLLWLAVGFGTTAMARAIDWLTTENQCEKRACHGSGNG